MKKELIVVLQELYKYKRINNSTLLSERAAKKLEDKLFAEVQNLITPFLKNFSSIRAEYTLIKILIEEYPYLLELIQNIINSNNKFTKQFLLHYVDFLNGFFEGQTILIKDIELTLADPHKDGSVNLVIMLSNNTKWVYKPRSSFNEIFFQDLVNKHYKSLDLLRFETIYYNNDEFSFCEYVEHKQCNNITEIENFYLRCGIQLYLLWVLGCSDINHENLIASGEFPVIIDLELILAPSINEPLYSPRKIINSSVLSTLMLPKWVALKEGGYANMSALSDTNDSLNYLYKIFPSRHIPFIKGLKKSVSSYAGYVKQGFINCSKVNEGKYFENILSLNEIGDLKNRVVLKPTSFYRHVIEQLNLPENLKSEENQKIVLEEFFLGYDKISEYERMCLLNREIPIFHSLPKFSTLYFGNEKIENFFSKTGIDNVKNNIDTLYWYSIPFQEKLIEKSIEFLNNTDKVDRIPSNNQIFSLGDNISREILNKIFVISNSYFWLQDNQLGGNFKDIGVTGIDLLNGNTGIVLALLVFNLNFESNELFVLKQILNQDLSFIDKLINQNKLKKDQYLIVHKEIISTLCAAISNLDHDKHQLINLFKSSLSIFENTNLSNIIQKSRFKTPMPDLEYIDLNLVSPYLIGMALFAPNIFVDALISYMDKKKGIPYYGLDLNGLAGVLLALGIYKNTCNNPDKT